MGDNLEALAIAQELSREEIVQLARNSLEISWADPQRVDAWVAQLEEIAAR